MSTDFENAKESAIGAMRAAKRITEIYSNPPGPAWPTGDRQTALVYRASDLGRFIRQVEAARETIAKIEPLLLVSKLDVRPIRSADIVAATAHEVAIKFANGVQGAILSALGETTEDPNEYAEIESGNLTAGQVASAEDKLRGALSNIELVDQEELYFTIKAESAMAAATNQVAVGVTSAGPTDDAARFYKFAAPLWEKGIGWNEIRMQWLRESGMNETVDALKQSFSRTRRRLA